MTARDRLRAVARTTLVPHTRAVGMGGGGGGGRGGGGEPEPPPPTEPLSEEDAELAAHLSEKTMLLWEYYNNHDLESLRTLYEPNYWLSEEEEPRRNMAPFESRSIKFTPEKTSPPREIEPGIWQVKHTAHFSGGSVKMKFLYE